MSAVFSECGLYRYRLDIDVQMSGIVLGFFGVNPSVAGRKNPDGTEKGDPTARKWVGFSKVLGARKYIAGNPFALVATNVKELAAHQDPIGPVNDASLRQIIVDSDVLIPCWGNRDKLPKKLRPRLDWLSTLLHASGKPVRVFGFTKTGDPIHPLMLGYKTPIVEWKP